RLALGRRGDPRRAPARHTRPCRLVGNARRGAPRPRAFVERPHERRRSGAPRDGDDRVLRPQGGPARRGRRRAVPRRTPSVTGTASGEAAPRPRARGTATPARGTVTRSNRLGPAERDAALETLRTKTLDILVIGGGVVGTGAALDAATRGLRVGLVEQRDFGSGTSSRSSKLVHGVIRYLEQLDFALVRESLIERGLLL